MQKTTKKPYQYTCIDDSILLPYYKQYFVTLVYRIVPSCLTANSITLLSSMCMWIVVILLAFSVHLSTQIYALLYVILLQTYSLGDTLDGMRAKNTGTSSPLGEFLDHYFDTYNNAIVFLMIFSLLHITNYAVLYISLWMGFLAFAAVMTEEKLTGKLYFGKIGALEGMFLFTAITLLFTNSNIAHWFQTYHIYHYPVSWLVMFIITISYFATYLISIKHMPETPRSLYAFAAVSCLLGIALGQATYVTVLVAWFALSTFCATYIGNIIFSHLADRDFPRVDTAGTFIILALFIIPKTPYAIPSLMPYLWDIATCYFILRCLMSFFRTTYYFREYWQGYIQFSQKPQDNKI